MQFTPSEKREKEEKQIKAQMGGFVTDNFGPKDWWEQLYLGLLWAVIFTLYFVSIGIYLRRRHTPSIAQRLPITVVAGMWFLGGSLGISQVGELIDPFFGCRHPVLNVVRVYGGYCFFALMMTGIWRLLQLIHKFESQRIRLDAQLRSEGHFHSDGAAAAAAVGNGNGNVVSKATNDTAATTTTNFWQRNLSLLTSYPLAIALVIYTLIPPLWMLWFDPPMYDEYCQGDEKSGGTSGLVIPVFLVPLMILIVGLAWKVRTIEEGFQIVRVCMYLVLYCLL